MKEKKMSSGLQTKVKKYLEYMFQDNQEQKRAMLFDSLSHKLKEEVQIDIYGKVLKNSPFFKSNFSDKFLKKLSLKISEVTLAPEEQIFSVTFFLYYYSLLRKKRHEFTERGVHFIIKGNVNFFITKKIGEVTKEITLSVLGVKFLILIC